MFLTWNDLTEKEQEQAENSYLSMMEDMAFDNEWDRDFYENLKINKDLRIQILKEKFFIRDEDGYIFVSL